MKTKPTKSPKPKPATAVHLERKFEQELEAVLLARGYTQGHPGDFNAALGMDDKAVVSFIQETQPKAWDRLAKSYGHEAAAKVTKYLRAEMNRRGTVDVLRHGITDRGNKIKLAFMPPASGLNPEVVKAYKQNRLTLVRQLPFNPASHQTIDTAILLNGIPLATLELKTHLTGQTVENAISQYRNDRDPQAPVLGFKSGAIVHFAVDPDEVWMTTHLCGKATKFLPFNKGYQHGKGNPPNPKGYKTAYLWEEVLEADSLMDIVARFVQTQTETKRLPNGTKVKIEKLLFPRYHQLDVVRECAADAEEKGAGQAYLVQHSAGSGKTNSIAWLAHRLSTLHDKADNAVFDSVIVVTDRIVLDSQLQDAIAQFEHKQGVVEAITSADGSKSEQLSEALTTGKKIIIVTIQSFRFVLELIGKLPNRRYAVIVDEAHSSQTGESATKLRATLGANDEEALALAAKEQLAEDGKAEMADEETEIEILKLMKARQKQPNLSFFAFTATPKAKTLEYFGRKGKDGKPKPFHLYSMRQAIEEGFILDVLKNYVTYETYWKIATAKSEDPELEKKKASRAAVRFVELHPYNIAQKVEIILYHYLKFTAKKIGGRGKAMVVTSSRKAAVRYKEVFDKALRKKGIKGVKAIVAFSGEVEDGGKKFTEGGMNGFPSKQIPEKFETDDYQVLLVADKFQTGFDQPYLHTLFVDKRLDGVQAVQTLSRVNRTCPLKDDTFILDFVNKAEDIRKAFKPYYEATEIKETTDPNVLYQLKDEIIAGKVIHQEDVEAFAKIAFKPVEKASTNDQGLMHKCLDPAVARFNAKKNPEEKREFVGSLQSYVRVYSFLAQLLDFEDTDLEKLHAYAQGLLRKLPKTTGRSLDLEDDLKLTFYRPKQTFSGDISLKPGETKAVSGLDTEAKPGGKKVVALLSTIVEILNAKFGTNLTPEDQLLFEQIEGDMAKDADLQAQAASNDLENFSYPAKEKISGAFLDRTEKNQSLYTRYLSEEDFRNVIETMMTQSLYDKLRSKEKERKQA